MIHKATLFVKGDSLWVRKRLEPLKGQWGAEKLNFFWDSLWNDLLELKGQLTFQVLLGLRTPNRFASWRAQGIQRAHHDVAHWLLYFRFGSNCRMTESDFVAGVGLCVPEEEGGGAWARIMLELTPGLLKRYILPI